MLNQDKDRDDETSKEKNEDDEWNRVVSEAQERAHQKRRSDPFVHRASLGLVESFLRNERLFFRAEAGGTLAKDRDIRDAVRIVRDPLPDDPAWAIREWRRRRNIGAALDSLAKRFRAINLTSGRKKQLSLMRNACTEFRRGFRNAAPRLARGRPRSLDVSKELRAAAREGFTKALKAMGFVRRNEANPTWLSAEADLKRACKAFGFLKAISAYVKREFGDDYPLTERKKMIRGLLVRGKSLEVLAFLFFTEDTSLPFDMPSSVRDEIKRIRRSLSDRRRGPAAAADVFVSSLFGVSIRRVRAARPSRQEGR